MVGIRSRKIDFYCEDVLQLGPCSQPDGRPATVIICQYGRNLDTGARGEQCLTAYRRGS